MNSRTNNDCSAFMRQIASRQREGAGSLSDPLPRLRNVASGSRREQAWPCGQASGTRAVPDDLNPGGEVVPVEVLWTGNCKK